MQLNNVPNECHCSDTRMSLRSNRYSDVVCGKGGGVSLQIKGALHSHRPARPWCGRRSAPACGDDDHCLVSDDQCQKKILLDDQCQKKEIITVSKGLIKLTTRINNASDYHR